MEVGTSQTKSDEPRPLVIEQALIGLGEMIVCLESLRNDILGKDKAVEETAGPKDLPPQPCLSFYLTELPSRINAFADRIGSATNKIRAGLY